MLQILAVLLFLCAAFPTLAQSPQNIVCFGDSLTAGFGSTPGKSYPDFLRKDLVEAGYHVTLINRGVSGDTTKDGTARVPAVLALHPAIVILEFGANDGIRGQPVPGIAQNLSAMIQTFQRAHIRVLLLGMNLPPNLGPEYTRQFDALYPTLAARYRLPVVPFLLKGVYDVEGLMSSDYIHPNGAGYEHVAQNVLPVLEPMLSK